MSTTFETLGDMLQRRYVVDYIAQMEQLSAPIFSMLRENNRFIPSGDGAYFPLRVDGNESGGGWRATDDNRLPSAGNERIIQARVRPRKYYHVVTFSGLAEAVSQRGGEDAFAAGITDAIATAVKRAGANFEYNYLRSDGSGRLAKVRTNATAATQIDVDDARGFRVGKVVVFLNTTTGLRTAGPVVVKSRTIDTNGGTVTVSSAVTVTTSDGIFIQGEQSESMAPSTEVTALGLPGIVANTGTIYNLSRTTFPILQSKIIDAASTALDESMLRRLRKQLLVETDTGSMAGFHYISNWDQFDRYTEISLPFRRFNDMTLELGASQEMTAFEGRPWLISWAADPARVYMCRQDAIERGVLRPLSIDERVNMQWVPGQDAFTVLLKAYYENVARWVNQTAAIVNLSTPTY